MSMGGRCNDICQGKSEVLNKDTCASAILSTTNPTWISCDLTRVFAVGSPSGLLHGLPLFLMDLAHWPDTIQN